MSHTLQLHRINEKSLIIECHELYRDITEKRCIVIMRAKIVWELHKNIVGLFPTK